ncbi:MAG TPA: prepilin-type N-terminal cleavage/methylation domain-containing protein [Pseudomonadales bacterium]|nr:prepilin-type N-terminal cleavage/methylation domain-containing protein [Pseudomonadales bacterium]
MKFVPSKFSRHQNAMTLLELVVVIAILAVLTTVAMRSLTGVAGQSRFEVTQQTLDGIREAILGAANDHQPDGSLVINGFIADIGRPPVAELVTNFDGTQSLTLDELLVQPPGALPFDVRPATATNMTDSSQADSEVLVPCGWRGPYLRLSAGANQIMDGWGFNLANPYPLGTNFVCLSRADSSPVNPGDEIAIVSSPGADGVQGGSGYDTDLSITNPSSFYSASLVVTVSMSDTNGNSITSLTNGDQVIVRVFGPDTNNLGRIAVQSQTNANQFTFPFVDSLTQGPRAVRAYLQTGDGIFTNSSVIDYLNLHPGFNTAGLNLIRPY